MTDILEVGRNAFTQHAWADAIEAFSQADQDRDLSPADLESLGLAAWWAGRPDDATEALERAFRAYVEAGRTVDAAGVALKLAYQAFRAVNGSVGGGWLAQAGRILEDVDESAMHAWLHVFAGLGALERGRYEEGLAETGLAIEIARRHGNDDARYMAMSFRGLGQVFSGDWQTGLATMDEAAAAASSGQLDLRVASDIYCQVIAACRSVGDLQRSGQWADEGERWMRRNGIGGYPGICRVHRAELKMLRGDWAEAEREARVATEELERYRLIDAAGYAQNQVGEIRLRMGDLDAAAEAFDRAYDYGHDAQPGLSLLHLARGEVEEASRSINRAVAATSGSGGLVDQATRGRLLPAQVEIAIAAHDLDAARTAVEELEQVAEVFERPMFQAGALTARGELLLREARASEASPVLGKSWRLWQATDLPYEAARARLEYAEALAAEGDATTARRDFLAARGAFERLGASLDVERVDALLANTTGGEATTTGAGRAGQLRVDAPVTRTFMFTDIVTSTDLVGLIGDEAWNELLRWHDRELRAAFARHGGEEANHTGDGFFVAFAKASDGIECAVDIQRRLLRHRRDHGFAPWVRIGLHTADATRRGRNYTGGGVHVAARIGAIGSREEIFVSAAVLEASGPIRFGLSEPKPVTLKGVREPVEVRSVDWRQA
jgi:class 3 adenylate cyclase